MKTLPISESTIAQHYSVLNTIGCLGAGPESGFLRAAYSDEETKAMKYIEKCAVSLGAKSSWDAIGNLSLTWEGKSPKYVEVASHLDTVPSGGNYDGAAGVVAGLAAIEAIVKSDQPRQLGLRLRVWRCEESATYNSVYGGSLSAFGKLNSKFLQNTFKGQTLEAAMRSQGADPEFVRSGRETIDAAERDSIAGHIELHIEQGNVLEVGGIDVGVITSIRAPRRYRIILRGQFDHSGTTPMGVEYRRDVNLAIANMLVKLDELCASKREAGWDLVQTVGVINSSRDTNASHAAVYDNAVTKVSGFGYFCLDIRSASAQILQDYSALAEKLIADVAGNFRVESQVEVIGSSTPLEHLDTRIQEALHSSAKTLGISAISMPSGAGHDAAIVGAQLRSDGSTIPVGMLFIPCRDGKSHCPEEFATHDQIAKGASVLAGALTSLAQLQQ